MSVAVAEQLRGDRVTVGLAADQGAAEVVTGLGVKRGEQGAEVPSNTAPNHSTCVPELIVLLLD